MITRYNLLALLTLLAFVPTHTAHAMRLARSLHSFSPKQASILAQLKERREQIIKPFEERMRRQKGLDNALYFEIILSPSASKQVSELLAYGADANTTFENKESALHLAAENCDFQTVRALLCYGANPNAADKDGNVPLYYTMGKRGPTLTRTMKMMTVEVLIEAGARKDFWTLRKAVQRQDANAIEAFMETPSQKNIDFSEPDMNVHWELAQLRKLLLEEHPLCHTLQEEAALTGNEQIMRLVDPKKIYQYKDTLDYHIGIALAAQKYEKSNTKS